MERKRTSRASCVRPRWLLDPKIVCVCLAVSTPIVTTSSTRHGRGPRHLSRARHAERCHDAIGALAALGRQDALCQRSDVCGVEDVALRRVLIENACKGKLLHGPAAVRRRVERDMRGGRAPDIGRLDVENAVRVGGAGRGRAQPQVHVEEVVRRRRRIWLAEGVHGPLSSRRPQRGKGPGVRGDGRRQRPRCRGQGAGPRSCRALAGSAAER